MHGSSEDAAIADGAADLTTPTADAAIEDGVTANDAPSADADLRDALPPDTVSDRPFDVGSSLVDVAALDLAIDEGAPDVPVDLGVDAAVDDRADGGTVVADVTADVATTDAPRDAAGLDLPAVVDVSAADAGGVDVVTVPDVPVDVCTPPPDVPRADVLLPDGGIPDEGFTIERVTRGGAGLCPCRCPTGTVCSSAGVCETAPVVPRAVRPLSGVVTATRPLFRWARQGADGYATVEICRDAACTDVVATLFGADAARPAADLAPGHYFYRVFGRGLRDGAVVDGATGSPVRVFYVGHRRGAIDGSNGQVPDVNRDGTPDLVLGDLLPGSPTYARVTVVRRGSSSENLTGGGVFNGAYGDFTDRSFASMITNAGDINGDGFPDVVTLERYWYANPQTLLLLRGGPTTFTAAGRQRYTLPANGVVADLMGVGDVDGDGYADLGVAQMESSVGGGGERAMSVVYGSAAGLSARTTRIPYPRDGVASGASLFVVGLGDVDGDGYDDVAQSHYNGVSIRRLIVFRGGPMGLSTTPAVTLTGMLNPIARGDVDGDGYTDAAATVDFPWAPMTPGVPFGRQVVVYWGSATGLSAERVSYVQGPWRVEAELITCFSSCQRVDGRYVDPYILSIAAAGDVTGDGGNDLWLSGTLTARTTERALFLVTAGPGRVLSVRETPFETPGTDPLRGRQVPYTNLACPGDWNGDGFDDIATHTSVLHPITRTRSDYPVTVSLFPGSRTAASAPALLTLSNGGGPSNSGYGERILGIW